MYLLEIFFLIKRLKSYLMVFLFSMEGGFYLKCNWYRLVGINLVINLINKFYKSLIKCYENLRI